MHEHMHSMHEPLSLISALLLGFFSSSHCLVMCGGIAGVMLILMGFYVARWWMVLTRFERFGQPLWNALKPLTRHFMGSVKPHHQFGLGMLWGFLPCGLIYSALAWVAASGNPVMGAATMFAFGLGTLPALTAGTLLGNIITPWLNKPMVRKFAALLLITFGLWTIAILWAHA